MTFWPRLAGETGATPAELTRANFVAREIFGSLPLREEIETLRQRARRRAARPGCGSRCARWSSARRAGWSTTGARRSTARPRSTTSAAPVQAADGASCPSLLTGRELRAYESRRDALVDAAACPRTWPPGSRSCPRRTCCSASSRSPTGRRSTRSRSPGCTSRSASGSGCPTLVHPDPGAAARRPLADDGPGGAARRPVRRARPAHRPGAARHRRPTTPSPARIAAWEDGDSGASSPRAAATLEEICADDERRPGPDVGRACASCAGCSPTDLAAVVGVGGSLRPLGVGGSPSRASSLGARCGRWGRWVAFASKLARRSLRRSAPAAPGRNVLARGGRAT